MQGKSTQKQLERKGMLGAFYKNWWNGKHRRKKRVLNSVRVQLENCGYDVRALGDSELEAAVTYGGGSIEKAMPLTAKRTYWILRRLSRDVTRLRRRKAGSSRTE